jgi:hypothetical protein
MRLAIIAVVLLVCLAAAAVAILIRMPADSEEEQCVLVLAAAASPEWGFAIKTSDVVQIVVARTALANKPDYLVDPAQAVGKFPSGRIRKGDILTASSVSPGCLFCRPLYNRPLVDTARLWPDGCPACRRGRVVPEGMRIRLVPVRRSDIEGGHLYPHCKVDVHGLFQIREGGEVMDVRNLQGIEVLHINGARHEVYLSLVMTRDQAAILQTWLARGRIKLFLCSPPLREFALYDLTTQGATTIPEISSAELTLTQIVPTLETPFEDGKNAIWCASFAAAWKALGDMAAEPPSLDGSSALVASLNKAEDPREYTPEEALYTAAGWIQEGVAQKIRDDLRRTFPTKQSPRFRGVTDDGLVAYAYLEANVKFPNPYYQNERPLVFTDSRGNETKITSFGIQGDAPYALRLQPHILFFQTHTSESGRVEAREFAVDLCADSSPSQIVLALVERERTLAATIHQVEEGGAKKYQYLDRIGRDDVLLVPDLLFNISHHFSQLAGKQFRNAELRGQILVLARQDTFFRLDRRGVELRSEAQIGTTIGIPTPTYFVINRPFLVYMKKRGDKTPYFAMWVDNAELLYDWQTFTERRRNPLENAEHVEH